MNEIKTMRKKNIQWFENKHASRLQNHEHNLASESSEAAYKELKNESMNGNMKTNSINFWRIRAWLWNE